MGRVGRSRFLQTDPIPGGSANAYDYCGQDPINVIDLDGRQFRYDAEGAGGGEVGGEPIVDDSGHLTAKARQAGWRETVRRAGGRVRVTLHVPRDLDAFRDSAGRAKWRIKVSVVKYDPTKYGQPGKTAPLQHAAHLLRHILRHKYGWW